MKTIKFETTGYIRLEIPDKNGNLNAQEVDLFDIYNQLRVTDGTTPVEANRELVRVLEEFGFPDVTTTTAVMVLNRLDAEVAEVKKKDL